MLGAEPDPESHWRLLWDNLPIREELREFNFLEIKKRGFGVAHLSTQSIELNSAFRCL